MDKYGNGNTEYGIGTASGTRLFSIAIDFYASYIYASSPIQILATIELKRGFYLANLHAMTDDGTVEKVSAIWFIASVELWLGTSWQIGNSSLLNGIRFYSIAKNQSQSKTWFHWLTMRYCLGETHEAVEAKDGVLAGNNSAFEFHSLVGTQLASRIDRRTCNSNILVKLILSK